MDDPHKKSAWAKVYDAYQRANPPNLMPGDAGMIATLAMQWTETKDPSLMDALISLCHQKSLPILPEALEYVHAAMQKRIRDASSGTKAFRDAARRRLLEEMAKLIYHGATVDRASELAAYASHGDYPFRFKASTLIKAYAKDRDRLTRFATEVCGGDHLTNDEAEAMAARWRAIINQPLVVSPEIKGEVR